MKIVIAIDSFKGSVSAVEAGERLERGIRKVVPQAEVVKIPISDGGEGLLIPFFHAVGGTMRKLEVKDPLGRTVGAEYLKLPDGTAAGLRASAVKERGAGPAADHYIRCRRDDSWCTG